MIVYLMSYNCHYGMKDMTLDSESIATPNLHQELRRCDVSSELTSESATLHLHLIISFLA